jgi:diguanylate cyclase (GGDEF)-like protein
MNNNVNIISKVPKKKVMTIGSDHEVNQILEVNLTHANFIVIDAGSGAEVISGVLTERPDIIILSAPLFDGNIVEICQQLKESPQTGHIPVIILGIESIGGKDKDKIINLVDLALRKPFDPKEIVSIVKTYSKGIERSVNINQLTGLPNQTQIYNEIASLLEQNRPFAAIYVDMDDFRGFNKVYGFNRGDGAIRFLSSVLNETVRLFGNPDDLVGHFSGDNFIIISTPQKARIICRRLLSEFDRQKNLLYDKKDVELGYAEYTNRLGKKEQLSIMDLRVAVVTNEKRIFHHYLEVDETAAEQMEYLKRFPGSNCYFDLRENGIEPEINLASKSVLPLHRQELKALQGVLAWIGFLTKEIDSPISSIDDCLGLLESTPLKNYSPQQMNNLTNIRDNTDKLLCFLRELTNLTRGEWITGSPLIEEANIKHIFDWILDQVNTLAKRRRIRVKITGLENISQVMLDGRALTEGLFHITRSLIKSSRSGDYLNITASNNDDGNIIIAMTNPTRFIPNNKQPQPHQARPIDTLPGNHINEFYIAQVCIKSIGGVINIRSTKESGFIVTIVLPKRWKSPADNVNALLHAADFSRNEARTQINKLSLVLSSHDKQIQSEFSEPLKDLKNKIQELLILCNRSLFLANELNNQLEMQQDRILQQEDEQLAATEAFFIACKEISKLTGIENLFDTESSRRVAKYASVIANEFKLSTRDQQALHHAAMLKDLGLISSVEDMVEQRVVLSREQGITIKEHAELVWKAIAQVGFLSRALIFILHRYERFDGKGYLLGVKGINIPLGAKILAVADGFDSLVSGLSPAGKLDPRVAAQKIAEESGQRFESDVVSAFLRAFRRGEFTATSITPGSTEKAFWQSPAAHIAEKKGTGGKL